MEKNFEAELAARFDGKLLLRREIPFDEQIFQQLTASSRFIPLPSITRKKFSWLCRRCGNQKHHLFASIPCPSCDQPHVYCRNCIEMGRVMACEPLYSWNGEAAVWKKHENPCTWQGELTPEQETAANRIRLAVERKESEVLVWAVTGAGKTEMLFPGITDALKQGKRICIATPRADVVRELLPRIRRAFAHIPVEGLYSGSEDKTGTSQLVIATTHQLLRYQEAFDLLIIDEIDAFPFHHDASLAFAADRAKKHTGTAVYLTATPRRKQLLRIHSKKLPHVFVPIRFHRHPLPVPRMQMCFTLEKDLQNGQSPAAMCHWLRKRKNPGRQLLVFVPTIRIAGNMREKLADLLVKEEMLKTKQTLTSVHAADPDREEKVQQFRDRKLSVLITTTILERGVTFPSVDVAVLHAGHAVFDEAALVQIAGRAGRSPDDPDGEVVFFHDGKTEAMVRAIDAITEMNRRGGFR